jgi:hypothetical protein
MKLHEIIEINEDADKTILYEALHPYMKSLYVYYSNYFTSDPVLMVTDVFNAAQYAKIVPADELMEAVNDWVTSSGAGPEDIEAETETILFQSKFLRDLL